MTNEKFLTWIADRMVNVHHESENFDYIIKLRRVATYIGKVDEFIKAESKAKKSTIFSQLAKESLT
jgi:hypothetical protein